MRSSVTKAAPKPMMGWDRERNSPRITNGSISQTKSGSRLSYDVMNCALISMAILFGGIHLFAWDYKFPTEIEQLLWRIATLSAMFLPVLWVFVVQLESLLPPKDRVKKLIMTQRLRRRLFPCRVPLLLLCVLCTLSSFPECVQGMSILLYTYILT